MDSPAPSEEAPSPYRPFTTAERIRQLNEIDQSIIKLLQSAGLAIKTLSNAQTDSSAIQTPPSATTRKELFSFSANTYLSTLQSIDVRLQRSIIGLEEAGIIVAGRAKKDSEQDTNNARGQPAKPGEQRKATEFGLGNLDVGWLNSRCGRVGREMEAELWAKAKLFLEEIEDEKNGGGDDRGGRDDEVMEL